MMGQGMWDEDNDQEQEGYPDMDNFRSGQMPPAMPAMPGAGMGPSAAPNPGYDMMGGPMPVLMGGGMSMGAPAGRMPMPPMNAGPMAGPGMGPMRPTGNQLAQSLQRLNRGAGQVGQRPVQHGGPMGSPMGGETMGMGAPQRPNRFLRAMRGG